jgi:hypothetical protein
MGIWGDGVFDNDDASDFLGDTVRGLCQQVRDDIAALGKRRGGGSPVRPAVAAIACLSAIAKAIDEAKFSMQKSEVESWRDRYFHGFDETVVPVWEKDDREGTRRYREAVLSEFQSLIARLEDWDDWEP